jgi:hypothetical protein
MELVIPVSAARVNRRVGGGRGITENFPGFFLNLADETSIV